MIDLENIKQQILSKFRKVNIGANVKSNNNSISLIIELNIGDIIVLKTYFISIDGTIDIPKYEGIILQEGDILTHIYNDIRRLELSLSKFSK